MANIPENVNNILQEFLDKVQENLGEHLKKIILYGSYARGDYNESSDVDIMILTDLDGIELSKKEKEIWDFAYDLEAEYDFSIHLSPFLNNIDFFDNRASFVPFYKNVQKEGVALING